MVYYTQSKHVEFNIQSPLLPGMAKQPASRQGKRLMELYINSGRACQGLEWGQQERISIHRAIALSSEISYCLHKQRGGGGCYATLTTKKLCHNSDSSDTKEKDERCIKLYNRTLGAEIRYLA